MKEHLLAVPTFPQETNTPDPQLRGADCRAPWKIYCGMERQRCCRFSRPYTQDGLLCDADGSGPHYGRQAIEKSFADGFKQFHFSNHVTTPDQYSPHVIGTAGNEAWAFGEWSMTIQGKNGGGPMQIKGNWELFLFVSAMAGKHAW